GEMRRNCSACGCGERGLTRTLLPLQCDCGKKSSPARRASDSLRSNDKRTRVIARRLGMRPNKNPGLSPGVPGTACAVQTRVELTRPGLLRPAGPSGPAQP